MAKAANVFVFFNCDGNKSESSMNIFYNNAVYKDTKTSRKALWKKIQEEQNENRVQIPLDKVEEVEKIILEGDPVEASNFIQFGAIKAIECF